MARRRQRSALAGSWVLVTGAYSGLGRELAEQLAERHSANLILVARRGALLADVAAQVRSRGVDVRILELDLTSPEAVAGLIHTVTRIDGFSTAVLCAGVTHFGPAERMSPVDVARVNALNVDATASLLLGFVRFFSERQAGGRILLISSMAGFVPVPFQAVYSASKAYLHSLVAASRNEQKGSGASITVAYPLGMDTEMTRGSGLQAIMERHPAGSISVARCANRAIDDLVRRRATSLVGVTAWTIYLLAKLLPTSWLTRAAGRTYRRAHADTRWR